MRVMTRITASFLLILVFGCKEISFKEPQPKGKPALSQIPKELRGKYLLIDTNSSSSDTLLVTSYGYEVASDSTKGVLSDSLVLKKYKGYYFFNANQKPEWLLRVIKREANGDLSYMLMDSGEKSFQEFVLSLNNEVKIDSFEVNDETLYQINPSPKQLVTLISKGYFRKTMQLKKIQ
jgi:hypothetical protein